MPTPLDRIPPVIIAGDTVSWKVPQGDFAPGTYSLKYDFVPVSGTRLSCPDTNSTVTNNGDGTWTVELGKNFTTALVDEVRYEYFAYVTETVGGAHIYTIDSGEIFVRFDPRTATAGFDGRSHARKSLDAIEAVMAGKATLDQQAYSIAGRSLSRYSFAELVTARDYYRREVAAENRQAKIARGENPGMIKGRFAA